MKKKKFFLGLLILIMILGIQVNVLAFDLLPNIDQKVLSEKQVKISLKLTDLQDYTNGINAVSGKIIYDTNVFESVSFTGMNNWSCAYNNEEGNESQGKFMLITTAGNVTKEKEVAQIELKLKPGIPLQETKIKIEEIQTSYHAEKVKAEDKEINLKIKENDIEVIQKNELKTEKIEETEKTKQKQEGNKKDAYILIAITVIIAIILIIFMILMIKLKERGKTNEK